MQQATKRVLLIFLSVLLLSALLPVGFPPVQAQDYELELWFNADGTGWGTAIFQNTQALYDEFLGWLEVDGILVIRDETLGTFTEFDANTYLLEFEWSTADTSFSPLQEPLSGGLVKLSLSLEDSLLGLFTEWLPYSVLLHVPGSVEDTNGNRESRDSASFWPSDTPTMEISYQPGETTPIPTPTVTQSATAIPPTESASPSPTVTQSATAIPPTESASPSPGSPSLTLTAPQAGEEILAGQAYEIQWESANLPAEAHLSLWFAVGEEWYNIDLYLDSSITGYYWTAPPFAVANAQIGVLAEVDDQSVAEFLQPCRVKANPALTATTTGFPEFRFDAPSFDQEFPAGHSVEIRWISKDLPGGEIYLSYQVGEGNSLEIGSFPLTETKTTWNLPSDLQGIVILSGGNYWNEGYTVGDTLQIRVIPSASSTRPVTPITSRSPSPTPTTSHPPTPTTDASPTPSTTRPPSPTASPPPVESSGFPLWVTLLIAVGGAVLLLVIVVLVLGSRRGPRPPKVGPPTLPQEPYLGPSEPIAPPLPGTLDAIPPVTPGITSPPIFSARFCPNCGSPLDPGERFCTSCGKPIG
jgi:hypothetical protein